MSNRELAILSWIVILFLWVFIDKRKIDVRNDLISLLKNIYRLLNNNAMHFFELYELIILCFFVYISSLSLIVGYIISLFTIIFPLLAKDFSNDYISDFKQFIKNSLLFSGFFTFLVNEYTFSFWIEFIISPIIIIIFMLSEFLNNSKNGNEKLGKLLNDFIFIIFLIILIQSIYQFILNYNDIITFHFWFSYFMPVFVFLVHLPFFYLWRFIIMVNVSMQWFDNKGTIYYIKYLIEKKKQNMKLNKNNYIDWTKVNVKQKSNSYSRNYKLILKDNLSLNKIEYIVKSVECMNAPKSIYETKYIYFPIKIWVIMNNKLIGIWQDERLNSQYKKVILIYSNFHKVDNGLYIDTNN